MRCFGINLIFVVIKLMMGYKVYDIISGYRVVNVVLIVYLLCYYLV